MEQVNRITKKTEIIKPIDRIEVLIIVDNYVDLLLPDSNFVNRAPVLANKNIPRGTLFAEHGLSLMISVYLGEEKHSLLFDTGYTEISIMNNINKLMINPDDIEAIVISHFHMDHTGGINSIVERCKKGVPIFVHPDAFIYPRYMKLPDGRKLIFPRTLQEKDLLNKGTKIVKTKQPTYLFNGLVLVSGEIERLVDFEKGMPNLLLERNGIIEKDIILDDQALIIYLKDKGLIIISGCAHSGIINTINYAKKITNIDTIYAVIGGFHLSGQYFESAIIPTISELKKLDIKVLVPMHCTGWKASKKIADEFSSFILSSVGTKIIL